MMHLDIYTLDYDNTYVSYACGFNNLGDVTVYLLPEEAVVGILFPRLDYRLNKDN